METHLQTLTDTLVAIKAVHNKPSKPARPFTSAILNTYKLDVLDFIRDADQFESNLFWYPPTSSALSGPSSGRENEQSIVSDIDGAPRMLEPRVMMPPTPLRKTAKDAEARGLIEFDARTLLKAAQRLLDNYHNAPRARKHVKGLLRKHVELQRTLQQMEEDVGRTDALIEKIQSGGQEWGDSLRQSRQRRAGKAAAAKEGAVQDVQDLTSQIQREEMEVMALEQMIEDAHSQRKQREAKAHPPKAADRVRTKPESARSTTQTTVTPHKNKPPTQSPRKHDNAPKTPRQASSTSSSTLKARLAASGRKSVSVKRMSDGASEGVQQMDETIRLDPVKHVHDNADETIRLRPEEIADPDAETRGGATEQGSGRRLPEVQSSDELERICENIWKIFGDHLRYVSPNRESGDYADTLQILSRLSVGLSEDSGARTDDASVESTATVATSGSTVGSTSSLTNLGTPTAAIAISSYILKLLLQTSPPHSSDFDELKKAADQWWSQEGKSAFMANTGTGAADLPTSTSTSTPGSTAIINLTAKKLLKVRFQGKQRFVSFAANI